jgi:hypothetical protein
VPTSFESGIVPGFRLRLRSLDRFRRFDVTSCGLAIENCGPSSQKIPHATQNVVRQNRNSFQQKPKAKQPFFRCLHVALKINLASMPLPADQGAFLGQLWRKGGLTEGSFRERPWLSAPRLPLREEVLSEASWSSSF